MWASAQCDQKGDDTHDQSGNQSDAHGRCSRSGKHRSDYAGQAEHNRAAASSTCDVCTTTDPSIPSC